MHFLLFWGYLYTLLADELADAVVDLVGRVRGVARSKGTENHKHGDNDGSKDHQFAENWASVTKLLPLHATLTEVLLKLLTTKLVVNEATESNAVAKGLEKGNRVLEEEHGCENKKNVLENAGESKDERRGLANLRTG